MVNLTLPGYNYLGPGNDPFDGSKVVNSADAIAKVHDLEYTLARTAADVKEADRLAIKRFYEDWKKTGTFGDLAGFVGLGAKYGFEHLFGVQYPSMSGGSKKPSFSRYLYAERERHLAAVWNDKFKNHYPVYSTWKKSPYGQYELARFVRGRDLHRSAVNAFSELNAAYNDLDPEPEAKVAKLSGPELPDSGADANAGADPNRTSNTGSKRPDEGPPGKKSKSSDTATDSSKQPADDNSAGVLDGGVLPYTPSSSSDSAGGGQSSTMDIDPSGAINQSGSGRGPTGGARSGATGPGVGSGTGGITWISNSEPSKKCMVSFKKSRIQFSYGYATTNVQLNKPDYVDCATTPLALIPVDYLPFYISEAEWAALPYNSKVEHVWCTVKPLGTRTAFDTGSTLSGTATSEYVPIGLVARGINRDFYGRNRKYGVSAAAPMVPTSLKTIDPDEMYKKYYEHIPSNTLCSPTEITEYYVHEWNRSSNPDSSDASLNDYIKHSAGACRMDEKVQQFLVNGAIGQTIASYEYTPRNGLIRTGKEHYVPWNRKDNTVESEKPRGRSISLQFFRDSAKKIVPGDLGLGGVDHEKTVINEPDEAYARQIENYGAYNVRDGCHGYAVQPQLHVGLVATPQLNPGTSATSFLNSCCYWHIECGIAISFNVNSAFSKNAAISWPLEVEFYPNNKPKYTDGQCLFGNTDTESGNVSTSDPKKQLPDDFEILEFDDMEIK